MNVERSSSINKEDKLYDNNVESDIENEENEQQDMTLGITYWIGNCYYHPHDRRGIWRLNKDKADYTISFKDDGYGYHLESKLPSLSTSIIPETIANVIAEYIRREKIDKADCFTTLTFEPNNKSFEKKIFRAHPNYQSKKWYDSAIIQFVISQEDKDRKLFNEEYNVTPAYDYGTQPSKLLAFFRIKNNVHAVIHSTNYKNHSLNDSVLTERWHLEYNKNNAVLRVVPIESIIDSVYVIQQTPGFIPIIDKTKEKVEEVDLVILVKKKETWASYFS